MFLGYWLIAMVGLGFLVMIFSSIGCVCMFLGNITGWEAKALEIKEQFADGVIELIDDEKKEDMDPYVDDTPDALETAEMKPLEALYHKYATLVAASHFPVFAVFHG